MTFFCRDQGGICYDVKLKPQKQQNCIEKEHSRRRIEMLKGYRCSHKSFIQSKDEKRTRRKSIASILLSAKILVIRLKLFARYIKWLCCRASERRNTFRSMEICYRIILIWNRYYYYKAFFNNNYKIKSGPLFSLKKAPFKTDESVVVHQNPFWEKRKAKHQYNIW